MIFALVQIPCQTNEQMRCVELADDHDRRLVGIGDPTAMIGFEEGLRSSPFFLQRIKVFSRAN